MPDAAGTVSGTVRPTAEFAPMIFGGLLTLTDTSILLRLLRCKVAESSR